MLCRRFSYGFWHVCQTMKSSQHATFLSVMSELCKTVLPIAYSKVSCNWKINYSWGPKPVYQHHAVSAVVSDHALYAKPVEFMWKHPEKYKVKEGVYHTRGTFLAIISKQFQDAGLWDLCIETGSIAEGSVAGVIYCHNCRIRLHKLVYEAFMQLAWQSFPVMIKGRSWRWHCIFGWNLEHLKQPLSRCVYSFTEGNFWSC